MTEKTPPRSCSPERSSDRSTGAARSTSPRRVYETPLLEVLGDIRTLTLGATPGVGDSTPPNTQPF